MDFVLLRSKDGEHLVNVDHIVCFEGGPLNTIAVVLTGGVKFAVTEIPEEIRAFIKAAPAPVEPETPAKKVKVPLSES